MHAILTVCLFAVLASFEVGRGVDSAPAPVVVGPCPSPGYAGSSIHAHGRTTITGRLVTRNNSGTLRPVPKAQFWYPNPEVGKAKAKVKQDGSFSVQFEFLVSWLLECKGDRLVRLETPYLADLIIRSPGCTDTMITINKDWVSHDVELRCKHSE